MAIIKYWDNVYSTEELREIWSVLDEIFDRNLWNQGSQLEASIDGLGSSKRRSRGFWLGDTNAEAHGGLIGRINLVLEKLYRGYTTDYASDGIWERGILTTNSHENLLGYYGDGDEYRAHKDFCPFTAITWFNREPKSFSGGELFFPELNEQIEPRNNRLVIFPGHLYHQVKPVSLDESLDGWGRFSITQFLFNDGLK